MTDSPLTTQALALAAQGIPVFPLLASKNPARAKADGGRGYLDATTDPATIRAEFARPGAARIGMPTGEVSGWDALDLDPRGGSEVWPGRLTLPATRVHATGGGGTHHLFRHAPGLRCSAGRIAPGVDVRADGGYVVVWPCSVDVPIAPWPADVLEAAFTPARAAGDTSHIEAPPSAAAVIDLLDRLPNPAENGRDVWTSVMLAAVGCVQVLEANGEDADGIAEAAARWADKWPGSQGYDAEMAKWESDWQYRDRPLAGWRNLCSRANREIPGYALERVVAEFAGVPLPPLSVAPEPARRSGLRLLSPGDCRTMEGREYVIKGLLARGDVACIFGAPGAGKSIVAPHLGFAIAQCRDVFGRRTREGLVFYVPAEDPHGMRQRVHGLQITHGDTENFFVVEGVGSLVDGASLAELVDLVEQHRPAMLVIDTVAMMWPGLDENTSQGMGTVVNGARALAQHGTAVVLIHHDTKAMDGTPRGHSLLNGALDMAVHLSKPDDDGIVRGKLTKNRNGICDADLAFRILSVPVGKDSDGELVSTPVAQEVAASAKRADKLPRSTAEALSVLRELVAKSGVRQPGGQIAVAEADWRSACDDRRVSTADSRESRDRVFRRAFTDLKGKGLVSASKGMVWTPSPLADAESTVGQTGQNPDMSILSDRQDGGGIRTDRTHPLGCVRCPVPAMPEPSISIEQLLSEALEEEPVGS